MTGDHALAGPDMRFDDVLEILSDRQMKIGRLLRLYEAARFSGPGPGQGAAVEPRTAQKIDLALQMIDDVHSVLLVLRNAPDMEGTIGVRHLKDAVKLETFRSSFEPGALEAERRKTGDDPAAAQIDLF